MEISTKEFGRPAKNMGEGSTNGGMESYLKATSGWTRDKVKELYSIRMDQGSKGIGATISKTKTQYYMSIRNLK